MTNRKFKTYREILHRFVVEWEVWLKDLNNRIFIGKGSLVLPGRAAMH